MSDYFKFILIISILIFYFTYADVNFLIDEDSIIQTKSFVYWPNATIPFYINPEHYDHEQSMSIMTSLSLFAFKTCLKFAPVMAKPDDSEHVMLFENPEGLRKCVLDNDGHSMDEPHKIVLGYECLKSPQIDMIIMRALGFPFEHNRAVRDVYIDVLMENIEPGSMTLFTKDTMKLPLELRALPFDVNSVMHFGNRDFSKNGHRTIIFKDHNVQQNRVGLTPLDLRKIEIVYGPECRKRDRQEKIELCQNYPGVARRKREVDLETTRSLRVNPDITPPPLGYNISDETTSILKDLGIENEVQEVVDNIYKVHSIALKNARTKYCNDSKTILRSADVKISDKNTTDILGILDAVADYAKNMVDNAISNLTAFCESSKSLDEYQRLRCDFYDNNVRCRPNYRSTKSGLDRYSTQHRPLILQSTQFYNPPTKSRLQHLYGRSGNNTDSNNTNANNTEITKDDAKNRKKRDIELINVDERKDKLKDKIVNVKSRNKREREDLKDKDKSSEKKTKTENKEDNKTVANKENDKKDLRMGTTVSLDKKVSYAFLREGTPNRRFRYKDLKGTKSEVDTEGSSADDSLEKKKQRKKKRKQKKTNKQIRKRKENKRNREERFDERIEDDEKVTTKAVSSFIPKTVPLSKMNEEFYSQRRWPDGIVRYIIKEDSKYDLEDLRQRLEEVNNILKRKTCVRLQEIREDDAAKYEDYLVLDTSPDYVTGRVGGKQNFGSVELFLGGQHRQHAAMMVMAMFGFYFEVSRHDRDKYIRVHVRHIRPDKLHHFEKIREDATLRLPYDYSSATHPAWQFWRKIGKTGISTVATYKEQDPDGSVMESLGQNAKLLSELDIVKINSVYGIKCFQKTRTRFRNKEESRENSKPH